MNESKRYAIWNNKGGVGKTTLTYLLATEYAIENKSENVVVIDMCPQVNISEMLLGGNGKGETNLDSLYNSDINIASYIKSRYDRSRFSKLGSESGYFIKVVKYNDAMPENIYLLPGHNDLDLCGGLINYLASAPEKKAWGHSRKILIDLITSYEEANKNKQNKFFIDCNPSFASYTELAILGSNRLIIPCTADAASIRGLRNIFKVVYGKSTDDEDNPFTQFFSSCENVGFDLPRIHSVIQNKSRSHEKAPSSAFRANMDELIEVVNEYHKEYPSIFLSEKEVLNVKDGNTIAAVLNHLGIPLSKLAAKKYNIYRGTTKFDEKHVDEKQKNVLLKDLSKVLSIL
uniref:AAA domain-containing protein n=1 Tax=Candidatus Kentrum sp. MB TaxID=2138164 RepID=A0A450XQJ3_9GAMM|nr:MAG: AAA domain-containing protein [Candidatus Kentron sp. MB]